MYRARRDITQTPCFELKELLVGGSERVLRHDSKALVRYARDGDLATLRQGHAVTFLPASDDHKLLEPPDTGTELPDALREPLG